MRRRVPAWALVVVSRMISIMRATAPGRGVKLRQATALEITARYLDAGKDLPIRGIDIVIRGLGSREEGAHDTAFGAFAPEPFDRPRRHLAVYLQNILPHYEGVAPVAGWRFGHDSRVGADDHSRVSAVYHIKCLGTKLKTVVGSGFKAPRLADLFLAIPHSAFRFRTSSQSRV
jgi:hypothetical protein